jgi:hypothetical protein
MSYILIISEVRRGQFEERNLDSIGLGNLLEKDSVLLVPEGDYIVNDKLVQTIIKTGVEETMFLNPMVMIDILKKVMDSKGKPEAVFLHLRLREARTLRMSQDISIYLFLLM